MTKVYMVASMSEAELIRRHSEHLSLRLCHWMFDGHEASPDIMKFVNYCLEQDKIDLETPRGPLGISLLDMEKLEKENG